MANAAQLDAPVQAHHGVVRAVEHKRRVAAGRRLRRLRRRARLRRSDAALHALQVGAQHGRLATEHGKVLAASQRNDGQQNDGQQRQRRRALHRHRAHQTAHLPRESPRGGFDFHLHCPAQPAMISLHVSTDSRWAVSTRRLDRKEAAGGYGGRCRLLAD